MNDTIIRQAGRAMNFAVASVPTVLEELSSTEQWDLKRRETAIRAALENIRSCWRQLGEDLAAIREQRLYRAKFATWEDYCQTTWGFSGRYGRNLSDAPGVFRNLLSAGAGEPAVLPQSESQVRPLKGLPAEEQREVWDEAVASAPAPEKVTARHVEAAVKRRAPKGEEPGQRASGEDLAEFIERGPSRRELVLAQLERVFAGLAELQSVIAAPQSVAASLVRRAGEHLEQVRDHPELLEREVRNSAGKLEKEKRAAAPVAGKATREEKPRKKAVRGPFVIARKCKGAITFATARGGWTNNPAKAAQFDSMADAVRANLHQGCDEVEPFAAAQERFAGEMGSKWHKKFGKREGRS